MLSTEINEIIQSSNLGAVDKLAIRTAIASLDLLKQASADLGCQIEALTVENLMTWAIKSIK